MSITEIFADSCLDNFFDIDNFDFVSLATKNNFYTLNCENNPNTSDLFSLLKNTFCYVEEELEKSDTKLAKYLLVASKFIILSLQIKSPIFLSFINYSYIKYHDNKWFSTQISCSSIYFIFLACKKDSSFADIDDVSWCSMLLKHLCTQLLYLYMINEKEITSDRSIDSIPEIFVAKLVRDVKDYMSSIDMEK